MTIETTVATTPQRERTFSLHHRDRILSIASPIGLLLVWEIAARTGLVDIGFSPAPSSILSLLVRMLNLGEAWAQPTFYKAWLALKSGELEMNTATSLLRLFWGTLLGGVPALVIGIAMGLSRATRAIVDP